MIDEMLSRHAVQYGHICRSCVHHSDWCLGLGSEALLLLLLMLLH
jgi:hypothetical protein